MAKDRTEREAIGESVIRTELPLTFESLTGDRVPATMTGLSFRPGEPDSSCEITLEVTAETARTIQQREWFHLFRGMQSGNPAWEPDRPVRIRAALRAELARQAAASGGDAESVLDALLAPANAEGTLPLRRTECWLALEMSQTVDLPDALKESGSLKIGLRTEWLQRAVRTSEGAGAEGQAQADGLEAQIQGFLQAHELEFEQLNERLIRLRFESPDGEWVCLIRLEEAEDACVVYSVFPILIPDRQREAVALALMSANYDSVRGNFEMDHEDGELRFRTVLASASRTTASELGPMLAEHVESMARYMPAIRDMLE